MANQFNSVRPENLLEIYSKKIYRRVRHKIYDGAHGALRRIMNPEVPFSNNLSYYKWLIKNFPRKADLEKMAKKACSLSYQPLLSIIVPTYNTPEDFLREMIESVISQVYLHWELCICDDASPSSHVREVLSEYATKDTRIKVVCHTTNQHISNTSNSAIAVASGEFICLLDHDDLLAPDALYEIVSLLNQHPDADMIYSDEDKILPDGSLTDVFFKQNWCPDSFLSRMYTCHLGTYRRSLVEEIGGFRPGYEGSQDYDLVLRFTEKTDKIFHIPKVLYHWRVHPDSTSGGADAKPYADNAGRLALQDALSRRGEDGVITSASSIPCCYTIRYKITEYKLVSIIITISNNLATDLDRCLNSIFAHSSYPKYEIILVSNENNNQAIFDVANRWLEIEPNRFKFYSLNSSLDISELNNYSVTKANGEYILFLNSRLEIITSEWLEALVEQVQRDSIGAAGCLLLNSNETIHHAGIIVGYKGSIEYVHSQFPSTTLGYFGCVKTINNYSAVSIDCLMCKRTAIENVGGFSISNTNELSGVDLCLKMIEKGYKNIYIPHIALSYQSPEISPDKNALAEKALNGTLYFQEKWPSLLDRDPCCGAHITLKDEYYGILK